MSSFTLEPLAVEPLRILLVEDSSADSDLLVAMLEQELPGALVAVSTSVAEAVPMLAGALDIAITDLSLPDAEGLQALTAILQARPDIAVVVMTGKRDHQLALAALSEGAEDYLVKGSLNARSVATAVLYAARRRNVERETYRYERLALELLDAIDAPTCAVDQRGSIIAVNRAWKAFSVENGGDAQRTGVGVSYFDVCEPTITATAGAAPEVAKGLRRVLAGTLDRYQFDYPCHGPDQERWFSLRIARLPETAGAVLTHMDISAAKLAEGALSHSSLHDVLTGLPNRTLLFDRLQQALVATARSRRQLAVAFLDIDQFKRVNDSLGHGAGDELLVAIAARLRESLRDGDTLSRFAGDEFVVVWPSLDSLDEAGMLAERLSCAFDEPFQLGVSTISVTASVGVAVGSSPQSADDLLLAADAAMYDAKHHGRGRTRIYTEELRGGAEARLSLEMELREALTRQEFVLHYQPVVDLQNNVVSGVEALVRWQHPDGLRMPDSFIPVAEACGFIVPLGAWVLEEACRQAAAWAADGVLLNVAVNLSVRQVAHPDIVPTIARALRRSGLAPARLMVEITESAVMEDAEAALVALSSIAEIGTEVAIDDFGTGYSSLVYLKRYPIHALKLDRSFVAGMGINGQDDAIVASVVNLAHAVGAVCIAEGVETQQQRAALRALGCQSAQGFLFGPGVPADQLVSTMRDCEALMSRDGDGAADSLPWAPPPIPRASWFPATADDRPFGRLGRLALRVLDVPLAFLTVSAAASDPARAVTEWSFADPEQRRTGAGDAFSRQLAASGRLIVVTDVSGDVRTRKDAWLEATGIKSLVGFPLQARGGEVLGMLCVGDFKRRAWTDDNLEVLAALAEIAISKAKLRGTARLSDLTAALLQRSMLTDLPEVEHLELIARYLPAQDNAKIGGDWYDSFVLPDGVTALAIGDVAGHDMPAAAIMGQLRNLLRGIAWHTNAAPHQVISGLDRTAHGLGVTDLATVIYARIEPTHTGGWRARWANAGHPPPLLVLATGETRYLDRPSGLLLAFGDAQHTDGLVDLPPMSTLLLYTDGLVESRTVDIDQGLEQLQRAAAVAATWSLERLCGHVLAELASDTNEDDVTLLAVRTPGHGAIPLLATGRATGPTALRPGRYGGRSPRSG
ncbi:MAG: hypothetical protein QOF39_3206 [Frankiales bacterium]|nr:hypothetical protein [Frankiales bacterium]